MLQFASSDSSVETETAKAESMSRRNHLHDQMRWRAVGMLQAGARQSAVARELNVHRSVIHRLWNHYQRDQRQLRTWVWTPENHHNGRRSLPVAMCQTPEDTNSATDGVAVLCCCRKAPYKLCRTDCMKEDCSHDDLLFVCAR
ncbi:hypothetical protein AVEN_246366-1 [Araneus ventricosus]|uniref:Transposase Tc1-like domain-containing protein n=1 Tax=Araneus ventricosus TaxID=182803 RepID=A0A4Y1ZUT2_ARAVE|nr:hypothetical protein AVEN_246366-1 [Araneus ventricosus]